MSDNIFSRSSRLAAITISFHWRKQNKQWCSKKKQKTIIIVKSRMPFLSINIYLFWLRIECSLFRHHWTLLNPYIKKDIDEIWHSITDQLESALCGKIYFKTKSSMMFSLHRFSFWRQPFNSTVKVGTRPVRLMTTFSRFALWYFKLYPRQNCSLGLHLKILLSI